MEIATLKRLYSPVTSTILVLTAVIALFSVWADSTIGGKEAIKVAKDSLLYIFASLALMALYVKKPKQLKTLLSKRYNQIALLFIGLNLIQALFGVAELDARLAGLLFNTRYIVWFFVLQAGAVYFDKQLPQKLQRSLIGIAWFLVVFAVLQATLLPKDFLGFFGYEYEAGRAYLALDGNPDIIRVTATTRGPNELGAFIMFAVLGLAAAVSRTRTITKQQLLWAVLAFTALFFTYSRSASVGLVVGLSILGFMTVKNKRVVVWSLLGLLSAITLLVGLSTQSTFLQNTLFHTEFDDILEDGADIERLRFQQEGIETLARDPQGLGTGSAGTASFYDADPLITENYFLQIAIELGVIGLILFVCLLWLIGKELWTARSEFYAQLGFISLFSFIAIGLFLHVWTDDLASFLWWGTAGIGLAKNK